MHEEDLRCYLDYVLSQLGQVRFLHISNCVLRHINDQVRNNQMR